MTTNLVGDSCQDGVLFGVDSGDGRVLYCII